MEILRDDVKLIVKSLYKKYDQEGVLNKISFEVKKGEFLAVLGPSGCGKTTLLRILIGLEKQDSGTIEKDGVEISNLLPSERGMGIIFQNYALFPNMTVLENVEYALKLKRDRKATARETAIKTLDMIGMSEHLDKKPRQLSGGQQQRACLAKALIKNPSICLFDEPLANLDENLKREIRLLIKKEFKTKNITIVYVTHNLEEAMVLADYLYVMENGEIVLNDTPLNVYNSNNELILNLKKEEEMKNEFIR